jgi:hypothetical protein
MRMKHAETLQTTQATIKIKLIEQLASHSIKIMFSKADHLHLTCIVATKETS